MKLALESKCEEIDDRPISYEPPEGNYRIRFCNFKDITGGRTNKTKIRFYWDILFPNDPKVRYRVWKDYPLEDGCVSKLQPDLQRIFGKDLSRFNDDAGILDTDKLLGEEAEVRVGKRVTREFKGPLTVVDRLYRTGSFTFEDLP